MDTAKLKKYAQFARRSLLEQVSAKLKLVLAEDSVARREHAEAVKNLEEAIKCHGTEWVSERVAYIWFNRFCALRFMDVNRYNRVNIVSPADPGQFQPEILAEAKMGHIDEEMVHDKVRQQIFALLDGKAPSRDPQGEAYRLLVVAACNFWNKAMPFLFQRIDDYTELLMPDDLLSGNSILAYTREAMTPDACGAGSNQLSVISNQQKTTDGFTDGCRLMADNLAAAGGVEVIGWLYQFYISEKKDEVFDGLKKNKKITPENIPAATQLFTPHWIVKYLVENSLGRLWMLNRPNSRLVDRMEYYIRPDTSGVRGQGLGVSNKTGGNYGSEELSGPDRLAEGDRLGGNGLSSDKELFQGGTLRADQSGSQGSSVNPVQHSGGARSQVDGRVQELSFDSAGLQSGSGNANSDRPTVALHISAASAGNILLAKGNLQNASGTEEQTNPWPLTPNPSASTREEDFLRVNKPEDIKICDPACGSGHMLTYAFDLLHAIYEEEGYEPAEIPEKILTNNLYGIEIDERAGELAAFALTMKARAKQRRFFNKGVKPNICVLENVHFDEGELKSYMDFVGRDLFTAPLQTTLRQFEEADNFGSLIRPDVTDLDGMLRILESKNVSGQLFISMTHQKVLQALRQADYLSPKYHVVIANPPYMGGKGMNGRLGAWVKENYPKAKSDLMTCFMERAQALVQSNSYWGMINLPSWMFLGSFESLRLSLITKNEIQSMLHLGRGIFGSDFGSVAFVIKNSRPKNDASGIYRRLFDKFSLVRTPDEIENLFLRKDFGLHEFRQANFLTIPGQTIAYWLSESFINAFRVGIPMQNYAVPRQGFATGENDRFLRRWQEVSFNEFNRYAQNANDANESGKRWFPCNKGGEFRKWYGNNSMVANWQHDGAEMRAFPGSVIRNPQYYFREGITWSTVTIASLSMRYSPPGFVFETKGSVCFPIENKITQIPLALMNTRVVEKVLLAISPTLDFHEGPIGRVPVIETSISRVTEIADRAVAHTKSDWDFSETSWDFTILPLLKPDYHQPTLTATYQKLRARWREMTLEMQRLEEENNRIFIEAYGLQDELKPEVSLNEITLTCNPHYRYGNNKSEEELEALLLADTMRELVSYGVGCMFGRYALEKPGLILANQGETIEDYLKQVPEPSFPADDDNVIPMLDGDWFTDDIAERFRKFLRVAFGDEHYEENFQFVEKALGKNGKSRDIRDYFLKDFYTDHVRRYKKRPIYWLFSSPKGSFNALIYMHRYRPDTVSVVLGDYLREFRTKLTSHKNHLEAVSISASSVQGEKTKALKEIEKITKMIAEMEDYEREVLYPLATQQVEIDLDDGVKVNYPKLGAALKKIVGLDAIEQ